MISASHNPPEDNGIKFFAASGYKLPDEMEDEVERLVDSGEGPRRAGRDVGRITSAPGAEQRYLDHLEEAAAGKLDGHAGRRGLRERGAPPRSGRRSCVAWAPR